MRVLQSAGSSFNKIDPNGRKQQKNSEIFKNKQENPLFLANSFSAQKTVPEEVFPYGHYTTKTTFWVAGN